MKIISERYWLINKRGVIAALAVMAVSALMCMLRALFFEDISDDLIYRYVLTPPHTFWEAYGARPVTSLADVIESQVSQWHHHSGRVLVHSLTQIFSALLGRGWFSVGLATVVFATEFLLWRFVMRRNGRYPLMWAVIVSVLLVQLYLCRVDSRLLNIMAFSFNYVWPLPFVIVFMSVVQRVARGEGAGRWRAAGYLLLAFLVGSTQEVFIGPLCGACFVLLVYKIVRRRKVTPLFVAMCVLLWVASALVVLAPGTLHRSETLHISGWLKSVMYIGFLFIVEQPLFLIMLAASVCFVIKSGVGKYMGLCRFEMLCLVFALMMALVAHTEFQSLSGVQIFSLIVSLACMAQIFTPRVSDRHSRAVAIVSTLIYLLFAAYQINLISDDYRYCIHNHEIKEAYVKSPDGIVEYVPMTPGFLTKNSVTDFASGGWNNGTLQTAYGNPGKPLITLTKEEINNFDKIGRDDSLRVPGDAGFYYLTHNIVLRPAAAQEDYGLLEFEYKTKNAQHPIEKLRLAWREWRYGDRVEETYVEVPKKEKLTYETIHTRYGDYVLLMLPSRPLSINRHED